MMVNKDDTRDVLQRARALLSEKGWCQDTAARNSGGFPTDPRKASAAAFDVLGALELAAHSKSVDWVVPYAAAFDVIDDACRAHHGCDVVTFNDRIGTTREDVLHLFSLSLTEEK